MPTTEKTASQRVYELSDEHNRLTARVRAGANISNAEFSDIKRDALAVVNQVEAMDNPTPADDSAAREAMALAEAADARCQLIHEQKQSHRGHVAGGAGAIEQDDFRGKRREVVAGNDVWQPLTHYSAADLGDLDDGGFSSMSEFLQSVVRAKTGRGFDERLQGDGVQFQAASGQNKGSDPYGGFLVPERLRAQVLMSADEDQPWLRMRREFASDAGNLIFPELKDRDRSNDDIAGFNLSRLSEEGALSDNRVEFASTKVELSKAGGLCYVSSELLSDSAVGVDATLNQVFGQAAAMLQAKDFIVGTGTGEPLGILKGDNLYTVSAEGGQDADTIVGDNILKMRQRCRSYNRAIWLAHPSTYTDLAVAHLSGTNSDTFLYSPGNGSDVPDTLLGRPIFYTEAAFELGDKGDLMLAVPSEYTYLTAGLRIDMSQHVAFTTDQVVFRVILRDDGRPTRSATHKDRRGFETSEFVTLAERS